MDLLKKYKYQVVNDFLEEDEFDKAYFEWIKKFGESNQSKRDFLWSVFQRLNIGIAKKFGVSIETYQYQRELYLIMLSFLVEENRNTKHIRKSIHFCDLMKADLSDYKQEVEFIATKCCEECDKINGQIIPLEEAIKTQPLPYSKCKRKTGCICCYGFKAVRDERGRIIMKN